MTEGPRTRSRLTPSENRVHTFYGKQYNGTFDNPYHWSTVSGSQTWKTPMEQVVMNDVVTPNYKARSAAGEIINSPMDKLITTTTYPVPATYWRSSVVEYTDKNGRKRWEGQEWIGKWAMTEDQLGPYLEVTNFPEIKAEEISLRNQAVSKAHADASSAEISALMVLGEGRKTVDSVMSILWRAFRIIKAVKNLDVKFLKKQISAKELSDRYMEARYALRPLMYDVEGATKAWQKAVPRLIERHTARGFTAKQFDRHDYITLSYPGNFACKIKRTCHASVGHRAGVLCDVELSRLTIWGVDTVFETALELVPFSFIINWFWNIADTLGSFTPKAGVRTLASWVTSSTVTSYTNELVDIWNIWPTPSLDQTFEWSGKKNITFLHKTRHVDPTRMKMPQFNVNIDTFKLLDLAKILSNFRN